MTSTSQMGFDDIGVDTRHHHIVQGFGMDTDQGEMLVSVHTTLESARSQLFWYLQDLEYNHGVQGKKEGDRFDFGIGEDADGEPFDELEPGWIRIVSCDLFPCWNQHRAITL